MGYYWNGDQFIVCTAAHAPKVAALQANPKVAPTIDTETQPPHSLLVRPDLDVSVTHILQRISRVYLLQSASFAAVFDRFAITFGEFEVLAALLRSGPPHQMSPGDLVGAVVLSSGAMTNRIDRVEALGLVERRPDPDDRRGTLVALTRKGERTVDAAVVAHLANEERLLGALSAPERRTLAELLRTLLLSEPFVALASPRTADHGVRRARRAGGRGRPRATA